MNSNNKSQTYIIPKAYDIAFDFRDVSAEVDFLLEKSRDILGRNVTSALELACGPAYHTREMARRKIRADGLDLEPKMVAYTRELIKKQMLNAHIFEGDMRYYKSKRKYDLVYMLMASFAHLLTNRDILDNFNCAADLLVDGGVYIISTAHPRDFYGDEKPSTKNSWTMSRGDITVETDWGGDNQKFDPLTEIDEITINFKVTTPEGTQVHNFPDRLRRLSMQTFDALVEFSGRFEIIDKYGTLDTGLKLSNDPKCWRFIPILKKIK